MELNIPSVITVPAEMFCPAVIIPTYCTCGVVWVDAAGEGEAGGRRQRYNAPPATAMIIISAK